MNIMVKVWTSPPQKTKNNENREEFINVDELGGKYAICSIGLWLMGN